MSMTTTVTRPQRRPVPTAVRLLAAATGAALLSSCGALVPSERASQEFTDHFTSTYPDAVDDVLTVQDATVPFAGSFYGEVVVRDDTPLHLVHDILDDVTAWDAPSRVSYYPVGVTANGVGICALDDRDDERIQLREALRENETRLTGSWPCPRRSANPARQDYVASVTDLVTDAQTVVALDDDIVAQQRVPGTTGQLRGSFDATWVDLAEFDGLDEVLERVMTGVGFRGFTITDRSLVIAIGPTEQVAAISEDLSSRLSPTIDVTVVPGGDDPVVQARFEQWGAVADELRETMGARIVTTDVTMTAYLASADALVEAVAILTDYPTGTALELAFYDAGSPGNAPASPSYRLATLTGEGADAHLEVLTAAIADDRIASMTLDTTGDAPLVRLTTSEVDAVAALKPVVPVGTRIRVTGVSQWRTVEFTAADTIDSSDVDSTDNTFSPRDLVDAWNRR